MKVCQASDRAAAVKSTSRIWCPRFKAAGRIAVFVLEAIKQHCRLMFWQLQATCCSVAGMYLQKQYTVNTHTHSSSCDHRFFIFLTHTHTVGYYCPLECLSEATAVRKALISSLSDDYCFWTLDWVADIRSPEQRKINLFEYFEMSSH